jgi:hypothetical protein
LTVLADAGAPAISAIAAAANRAVGSRMVLFV